MSNVFPAGWHPDPLDRYENRYWDGARWTEAVSTDGVVESDPSFVPEPPPAPTSPLDRPAPVGGGLYSRPTSMSVSETRERLLYLLPPAGIIITGSGPDRIDALTSMEGAMNMGLFVLLLFLCIVGGILYWLAKGRSQRLPFSLLLSPSSGGTIVTLSGNPAVWARLAPVMGQLPW